MTNPEGILECNDILSKLANPGICWWMDSGHLKTRPLLGRREGSPLAKSFYTSERQKGRPLLAR